MIILLITIIILLTVLATSILVYAMGLKALCDELERKEDNK